MFLASLFSILGSTNAIAGIDGTISVQNCTADTLTLNEYGKNGGIQFKAFPTTIAAGETGKIVASGCCHNGSDSFTAKSGSGNKSITVEVSYDTQGSDLSQESFYAKVVGLTGLEVNTKSHEFRRDGHLLKVFLPGEGARCK
jgi:hypothetical protein